MNRWSGLSTDKDVYERLKEFGDPEDKYYDLPEKFDTWARYLREGRRYFGVSKHSKKGVPTGHSVVASEQL